MGLTRNTFVLFSSDNGALAPRSNGPLRGKKSLVYEGGIREPAIMRWPGHIEPNLTSKEPAGLIDILPTFCQIAEAPVPNDRPIDGTSLVPLFNQKPLNRLTPLFWFFYRVQPAAALRDGDWTLVGFLDSKVPKSHALSPDQMTWLKQAKLNRFELYNLREDLAQTKDRAAEEPQRFQSMRRQMIDLHREIIAEGPTWTFPKN
jgi:arylsulfatase A